ncbi:molybdopterin molybdotransferase MoeA [Saliphagus sp. GCM10025308]
MDGYALRAAVTFGASERSPAVLALEDQPDPETALPGNGPSGPHRERCPRRRRRGRHARARRIARGDGRTRGARRGRRGRERRARRGGRRGWPETVRTGPSTAPSDLGLLRSAGTDRSLVSSRPTVGVVPTGEEVVQADPDPGEVIETNGLTVSRLVGRWGGRATHREVVTDDAEALRVAIQRDLTKDIVVTTGGSSVGQRDLLPEVIDDLGEVLVHGVALKPGHPVCLGIVEETPVLALPGYPVACLINAVQFLRPTLAWLQGTEATPHPTVAARLERKIASEPGTRTFARVSLEGNEGLEEADEAVEETEDGHEERKEGGELVATPTRASGSGVLSSVALADGWVVVPEDREGIPAGEMVAVENWEPWF